MIKILMVLTICFACTVKSEPAWELVKDKDNIQIFSVQKPSYKLKHYRAVAQINKDADTILNALQDTAACDQWVHNCISNQMVEMIDIKQRIFHTTIHSPLWFKDRDFYIQSQVMYEPIKQSFTISFESIPQYAEAEDNKTRIEDVEMVWQLKRVSDHFTTVSYELYIDPKLPIKTLNHQMIKKSIFKTFEGLITLVEKPKYSQEKYTKSELEMLIDNP